MASLVDPGLIDVDDPFLLLEEFDKLQSILKSKYKVLVGVCLRI